MRQSFSVLIIFLYLRLVASDDVMEDLQCSTPQFEGDWVSYPAYPIPLAESRGVLIGSEFIIFPGFTRRYNANVTANVYAYNFQAKSRVWQSVDEFPISYGLTHIAVATGNSSKDTYMCGGYVGPNPGHATSQCFTYHHLNSKKHQWKSLPRLPGPRAAGAMLYLKSTNQLLYTAGSSRPYPNDLLNTVDHRDTWMYNLSYGSKGTWISTSPYPINANHVGYTSVMYKKKQRHYVLGGQQRQFESNTSISSMFEWDESTNHWIERSKLLFGRGHFASATVPYRNCGFIIVGGTRDIDQTTGDVSYYDIKTDAWTTIGRMPPKRGKTTACVIHTQSGSGKDRYLSCQTGPINNTYSWQRKLS